MKAARWRCVQCGAEFHQWAPCERHADAPNHHRIEFILRRSRP